MENLLAIVKTALGVVDNDYNALIKSLINAAFIDMGFAGIDQETIGEYLTNDAYITAVTTYVQLHFGKLTDGEYDRLNASYDEQKRQMGMATGYTVWTTQE